MAVSLVSTGVQFPDSTIQTTAASAAPSATALGAVVLTGLASVDVGNFITTQTTLGSNNLFTTPLTAVTSSYDPVNASTSGAYASILSMSYSSYYGLWFGIAGGTNLQATSNGGAPIVSTDGLHWTPVLTPYTLTTSPFSNGIMSIGVNDSNGYIYLMSCTSTTAFAIYVSTDTGASWTQVYTSSSNWSAQYSAQSTFRYLNTGTASTSKSVFTIGSNSTTAVVVAPGNSNTFSAVTATGGGSGYVGDVRPAAVATYGTIMWYRHCDNGFAVYNGATGALSATTFASLSIPTYALRRVQAAINNSYFIAPSTTQGYISYGTISNATPTYVGQVLLPKNTSATPDPVIGPCVYDGTRWMVLTNQGMCYTTNANPSSGWTKAPMARGVISQGYSSQSGYSLNQRDPIR